MSEVPLSILSEMHRHSIVLKDPVRLLVSPLLKQWMDSRFVEEYRCTQRSSKFPSGNLFFRGAPVEECEQLQGFEYAFVNGSSEVSG